MSRRLFAVIRTLVVSIVFVSIWTWFLPRWFAGGPLVPGRPAGWILMVIGGAIMVRCCWDFAWQGLGTPFPVDPPRHLVVSGLYRYVRNPMYFGMGVFLIGEAILIPSITRPMLIMLAILAVAVNVFILAYEEPTLRRKFGDDYRAYCAAVRRWLPRLRPFDMPRALP